MGSGGKGGKGASSYNYFGTVTGAVCVGPVDKVLAVLVDGRTIVTGPITLSSDATNLPLDAGAEKYLLPSSDGGRITIYRGTATQTADAYIGGLSQPHPAYRGICYIVARHLLFGRERTIAPNLQVIVQRKPVVDTSIVAALDNTITGDGQCNPVAAIAELITSPFGLGLPVASLDAASWTAAGTWAAHADRIAYTHASPSFTSQTEARKALEELLVLIDSTLYWTPAGKLAIALLKPGVTPVSPQTIDARHITERHRLESPGWTSVPTSTVIRFPDRQASYKERVAKVDHLLALQRRGGVPNVMNLARPHITSADQASQHAAEMSRRAAQPVGDMDITVRRPHAETLFPGSKVLVDVDPEPGGGGLAQLCVVQEVNSPSTGSIGLRLRPDTLVEAVPYSPVWAAETPQEADCPPIDEDKAVAIQLPSQVWTTPAIAILAPRPRSDVTGFRVFFSTDQTDYADLGTQQGFACRAALDADIGEEDTEVVLTLPEGDTGPDAYLAERFPETQIGAAADDLLLFIAETDVNGRVTITGGVPNFEICSVVTRALVGADMTYAILRARNGTGNRAWTTTAKAWLIPGSSIVPWTHQAIQGLVQSGAFGYVRLVAYTVEAEDETVPIPEVSFIMPSASNLAPVISWALPAESIGTTDGTGAYAIEFTVTDGDGDLIGIEVSVIRASDGRVTNFPKITLEGVSSTTVTRNIVGLAEGTHTLVVTATDRKHAPVQSKRTLYRAGVSSLTPPDFDPPPQGDPWWFDSVPFTLTVTISTTAPNDRIEYAATARGSAQPSSGTVYVGTSKSLGVYTDRRIWARAGDGTTWSAWVFADYDLELGAPD